MRILSVMPINYKGTSSNKNNGVNQNVTSSIYNAFCMSKVNFGNGLSLPDNFGTVIKKKLLRGGLPTTTEHFKVLKEKGVTLILDLCGDNHGKQNLEKAKIAKCFGIKYVYQDGNRFFPYPILNNGANPKVELEKTAQIVKKELGKPKGVVYVHCRLGKDRTGLLSIKNLRSAD